MHKRITIAEFVILSAVIGFIGVSLAGKLLSEERKLESHQAISQIRETAKAAEAYSRALDKMDESEMSMLEAGYSVVRKGGTWYMVCDLDKIIDGSMADREMIINGLHDNSLTVLDDGNIALFLRFSADKQRIPSKVKGDFVNILRPAEGTVY